MQYTVIYLRTSSVRTSLPFPHCSKLKKKFMIISFTVNTFFGCSFLCSGGANDGLEVRKTGPTFPTCGGSRNDTRVVCAPASVQPGQLLQPEQRLLSQWLRVRQERSLLPSRSFHPSDWHRRRGEENGVLSKKVLVTLAP